MLQTIHTIVESVITLAFLLIFAWFADEVEEDDCLTEAFAEGYWTGVEPLPEAFVPDWFEFDFEFGQDIQDAWEEHLYDLYSF